MCVYIYDWSASMSRFCLSSSFLFSLVILSSKCIAAPVINNAQVLTSSSGKLSISIDGADFGSGPNVVLFDSFSGGKPGEAIPENSPEIGSWGGKPAYGGTPKYASGKNGNIGHGIRDFSRAGLDKIAQLVKRFDGDYTEIYFSYDVFVPEGNFFSGASSDETFPDRSTWKFTWLTSDGGVQADSIYDMCIPTHVGSGNFYLAGNDGNLSYAMHGNSWWSWHEVNHIGFWQKANANNPLVSSGTFDFYTTNKSKGFKQKAGSDTPVLFGSSSFNEIRFPGWFGNADQSNFNAIYDNVYIAVGKNSGARVEITDSKSYEGSSFMQVFPSSLWTENNIVTQLHGFKPDSSKSYYVHITDASGTRISTGIPVIFTNTGAMENAASNPLPPPQLKIQIN